MSSHDRPIVPIHFGFDLEPELPFPDAGADDANWNTIPDAFKKAEAYRPLLEKATGHQVKFGWYPRFDPQCEATYGDARTIAHRYQREIAGVADKGDEIGLHIHVFDHEPESGKPRMNYVRQDMIDEAVEMSLDIYKSEYGHIPDSVSMGNGYLDGHCLDLFEKAGVPFDVTLEMGLRRQPVARQHPDFPSMGERPDTILTPERPYRPAKDNFLKEAQGANARNLHIIPRSSHYRRDVGSLNYWKYAAFSTVASAGRRSVPRATFHPHIDYTGKNLPGLIDETAGRLDPPNFLLTARNCGRGELIDAFFDAFISLSDRYDFRFVSVRELVEITSEKRKQAA